jgi:hypothetical protein
MDYWDIRLAVGLFGIALVVLGSGFLYFGIDFIIQAWQGHP